VLDDNVEQEEEVRFSLCPSGTRSSNTLKTTNQIKYHVSPIHPHSMRLTCFLIFALNAELIVSTRLPHRMMRTDFRLNSVNLVFFLTDFPSGPP